MERLKPSFHHRPLNGPFEDPVVYVRLFHEKAGLLFDAGDLRGLPVKQIMRLSDLFITHAHIDHFVGFDSILRTLLRRDSPLSVYGPAGITECIAGKLKGYTWNLIREYPLEIYVHEVTEDTVVVSSFSAWTGFEKVYKDDRKNNGVLMENEMLTVKTRILDHGIPVLGFRMEEKFHININKDRLTRSGLTVGPWLNAMKKAVRNKNYDCMIDAGDKQMKVSDLSNLYHITKGQIIAYVMDSSPENENVSRIIELVNGCDTLYIESYFAEKDIELARGRKHLTSNIAGMIAREAGVGNLQILHLSPRYMDEPERLFEEAEKSFKH